MNKQKVIDAYSRTAHLLLNILSKIFYYEQKAITPENCAAFERLTRDILVLLEMAEPLAKGQKRE